MRLVAGFRSNLLEELTWFPDSLAWAGNGRKRKGRGEKGGKERKEGARKGERKGDGTPSKEDGYGPLQYDFPLFHSNLHVAYNVPFPR